MPTTPERLIEIATRHISHNERLKSHNVKEYADFLEDMKNSVTNQLANKDLTKFSRDRLLTLEKNIASDLKEINRAAAGTLKSQARDLAKYESQFEVKALSDVVEHSFKLPSTSQLNSAVFKTPLAGIEGPMKGKLLDSVIKDWSDRTVDRVNNVITSGYYQGKTTAAIVKDVVGTGANFTGGSLAQVKRDTEGLVRTSLQHAANQARQETWNQNSDIVKGVRIFATLDSRTSTICRSLDGQVYALDEGPRPPFHINCRTTTVAALDSRFKILDEDSTRSARDPETGEVYKVDSQRTYYDWLKGQPGNVQDSILGPTRGKLLRDGGLTSKRFAELQLSKNFQPMTLAEMKAIEPIAFEKAGIDLAKAGTAPGTIDLRYSPKKVEGKPLTPSTSISTPIKPKPFDDAATTWVDVTTYKEANSAFLEKFNIQNVVIEEVKTTDLGRLNAIGKSLSEDIYGKFPTLAKQVAKNPDGFGRLNGLYFDKASNPLGSKSKGVLANCWWTVRHIRFGTLGYNKALTPDLKIGGFTVGGDFNTTFRHEYGHHIHRNALTDRQQVDWENFFRRGYDKRKHKKLTVDVKQIDFYNNVSEYSATNTSEAFAESFAAITSPKYDWVGEYGTDKRLPKVLEDMMLSLIGKPKRK